MTKEIDMDMVTAAAALNGNEYGNEGSRDLFEQMKAAGLVAVFGASDDLIEFRGAIFDEVGAYGGTEIRLTRSGPLVSKCDDDDCPYFAKVFEATPVAVDAKWSEGGYSWLLETDYPSAKFDIVEDDEPYCRGLVISLADLPT